MSPTGRLRWLAADPGKAWAERFFLLYSPIWIALVAWALLSGAVLTWDDPTYLAFGLVVGAPTVVVPALLHRRVPALAATPWYDSYGFKFGAWIFVFVFVGTYFLTHYFFDVLGMRYTYHVVMLVLLRRARALLGLPPVGVRDLSLRTWPWARRVALALVTLALAYAVAYAETLFMAIDAIAPYFGYADKARMLRYGSLFYACYFLVSLPILARLDEPAGERTPLGRVILSSAGAGLIVMLILDLLAWIIGPIA